TKVSNQFGGTTQSSSVIAMTFPLVSLTPIFRAAALPSVGLFRYFSRWSVQNELNACRVSSFLLWSTTTNSKFGCAFAKMDDTVPSTNPPRLRVQTSAETSGTSCWLNSLLPTDFLNHLG